MKQFNFLTDSFEDIDFAEWMAFRGYDVDGAISAATVAIHNLKEDKIGYDIYMAGEEEIGEDLLSTSNKIKECELAIKNWENIKYEATILKKEIDNAYKFDGAAHGMAPVNFLTYNKVDFYPWSKDKNDVAFLRHCDMIMLIVQRAKNLGYFPEEWFENLKMMEEYNKDLISNETFDRFVETTTHYYSK